MLKAEERRCAEDFLAVHGDAIGHNSTADINALRINAPGKLLWHRHGRHRRALISLVAVIALASIFGAF